MKFVTPFIICVLVISGYLSGKLAFDFKSSIAKNTKVEKTQSEYYEKLYKSTKIKNLKGELIDSDVEVEVNNGGKDVLYPSGSKYNHYFSSGLYVREMFISGGYFGFTGIHNLANPLFVMKGIMLCTTKDGVQKLTAPMFESVACSDLVLSAWTVRQHRCSRLANHPRQLCPAVTTRPIPGIVDPVLREPQAPPVAA